ncbi:MAG: YciI family protein [Cyanobacteria bacterium P01_H01_bin.119]
MPWFVKIETGIVEKDTFDRYIPAHIAYVKTLKEQGHCARTGYWAERGGGMLLFQADSLETAKAILERDPLIQHGCVDYELHEWCVVVE